MNNQLPMFGEFTKPSNQEATRRALDELFDLARQYRTGKKYFELLQFISRFKSYSIFNALLVHVQMPGAKYVAPASRWMREYRRHIHLGARPLVILKPMGPVMFVFDVSDTEPEQDAPPLPTEVTEPFAVNQGFIGRELDHLIENAKRDGIKVTDQVAGSLKAGSIETVKTDQTIEFVLRRKPKVELQHVRLRYGVLLNAKHNRETRFASLVHELAHLYCGHLGSPDERWWPDRSELTHAVQELEAESVCYLVCHRFGIENPSEKYLSNYVKENREVAKISLDCVIRSATLIEQMAKKQMAARNSNITR